MIPVRCTTRMCKRCLFVLVREGPYIRVRIKCPRCKVYHEININSITEGPDAAMKAGAPDQEHGNGTDGL